MSKITTHVLDVAQGRPAANVLVKLEVAAGGAWKELGRGRTDVQGRLSSLQTSDPPSERTHRLIFDSIGHFLLLGG